MGVSGFCFFEVAVGLGPSYRYRGRPGIRLMVPRYMTCAQEELRWDPARFHFRLPCLTLHLVVRVSSSSSSILAHSFSFPSPPQCLMHHISAVFSEGNKHKNEKLKDDATPQNRGGIVGVTSITLPRQLRNGLPSRGSREASTITINKIKFHHRTGRK